jgi:lia operon protein LiaG
MTKKEYLEALNNALQNTDDAAREELLNDFEEHFAIGKANGRSDDDIMASLGPIDELVAALDLPPKTTTIPIQSTQSGKSYSEIQTIEVDSLHADVRVIPSVDEQTHVAFKSDGKLVDKLAYSTEVTQRGHNLHIKIEPIKRFFIARSSELTIEIAVASSVNALRLESASGELHVMDVKVDKISARSASGDVHAQKVIFDRCDGTTASGDLHFNGCRGVLNLSTASGNVYGEHHEATDVTVRSASGDVDYKGRCSNLSINTASGDGSLELEGANEVTIHTVSGDFDLDVDRADEGLRAVLKSVSGDLVVHSPEGTYEADRHSDVIALKNEAIRINLKSVSGDFKIRQHS